MTPEQIAGQLTEEQPALSWRTVMNKIVEAMARAMCRAPGSLCVGFCHVDRCKQATEQHGDAARAALTAEVARKDEALRRLAYWFDTDADYLETLSEAECADNNRMLSIARAALEVRND